MSLKNVELQIALPRTHDAGKIQSELQERSQVMNSHANQALQKEDEQKRTTVFKNEETVHAKWKQDEQQTHQDSERKEREKQMQDKEEQKIKHPFKGKFIDYIG